MSLTGIISDQHPMVTVTCSRAECGVEYLIPRHIYQQARELGDKRTIHCPNGHACHYAVSEAQRLRKRVDELERHLANALADGASARSHLTVAGRRTAYWKGIAHRKLRARR